MITHSERIERLTKLRELLSGFVKMHGRKVRLAKGVVRDFDMEYWDCGTAACALGAAALMPWFNKRGLHLNLSGDPVYGGMERIRAAVECFGLTLDEAAHLFFASYYGMSDTYAGTCDIKPSAVRKRVDALIKKYSK